MSVYKYVKSGLKIIHKYFLRIYVKPDYNFGNSELKIFPR